MSRWLNKVLKPKLAEYSNLCKDTPTVLSQLANIGISRGDILCKGDVKDYYMSGSHLMIAAAAKLFAPPGLADVVESAALHILSNQFVTLDRGPITRLWKVLHGAGMGLQCAGALADAAFITYAEPLLVSAEWRASMRIV